MPLHADKPYKTHTKKGSHMKQQNIAIFFGGCSSEYSVSLESAYSVIRYLDRDRYHPIMIGITPNGDWFHFTGDIDKIRHDAWLNDTDCVPAVLSPSRSDHKLLLLAKNQIESIHIDAAFPVLHGRNGEDGTIQGLIELAGIPLVGCGVLASSLCMDKDRAHKLVQTAGISVPLARVIDGSAERKEIMALADEIGYPLFVKPVKAGSSYGVTKVQKEQEMMGAVELALRYDDQVIIEENIDGFEVGCAVMGDKQLTVGEVDEIELSGGFFDFTEKYTLKTSKIHVPARISREKSDEIKATAKTIYKTLGCSGFARIDMFLTPDGKVLFNEVNTIPGFTEHSRYPSMMKAAGIFFPEVLTTLIRQATEK